VTPDQNPLIIVQIRRPGTLNDLIGIVLDQTDLSRMPEPTWQYKGSALAWDLYGFETHLEDTGPTPVWLDLALAEGDGAGWVVAMVTLPEDHQDHADWYATVFTHVAHALAPIDT
jgi:hypothetical protein